MELQLLDTLISLSYLSLEGLHLAGRIGSRNAFMFHRSSRSCSARAQGDGHHHTTCQVAPDLSAPEADGLPVPSSATSRKDIYDFDRVPRTVISKQFAAQKRTGGQPRPFQSHFISLLFLCRPLLFPGFPLVLSCKPRQQNHSITDSTAPSGPVKLTLHETEGVPR